MSFSLSVYINYCLPRAAIPGPFTNAEAHFVAGWSAIVFTKRESTAEHELNFKLHTVGGSNGSHSVAVGWNCNYYLIILVIKTFFL